MSSTSNVYLSIGSNVGERARNLEQALTGLEEAEVQIAKRSSVYETEPQDMAEQPWFLNMVVKCATRLLPLQLLRTIQRIEYGLGRTRGAAAVFRGPRTIDIDILLFAKVQMDTPDLTIPHPRLLDRRFVLEPLLEIAPDLRNPKTNELFSVCLASVAGQKLRKL